MFTTQKPLKAHKAFGGPYLGEGPRLDVSEVTVPSRAGVPAIIRPRLATYTHPLYSR